MSVYKVPQDVEADDKLLGPFNFRQFIYLMISAGLIFLGIVLFQIFPGLIIIPLPFLIFFLALALPLKKDQPMEMYLAAVVSFHLKPNKRLWQPDGVEHLIEIYAPIKQEKRLTKDLAQEEASRRFSYLADIVDTEGWAIKHAVSQNSSLHQDVALESSEMTDIFENRADRIDSLLQNNSNFRKQQIIENMNTARNLADYTSYNSDQIQSQTYQAANPADLYRRSQNQPQPQGEFLSWSPPTNQSQTAYQPEQLQTFPQSFPQQDGNFSGFQSQQPFFPSQTPEPSLHFNPYPDSIRQSVISPISQQPTPQPEFQQSFQQQVTYQQPVKEPSPEIIQLVSESKDLNIETLARQAEKIHKKQDESIDLNNEEEVIISLR